MVSLNTMTMAEISYALTENSDKVWESVTKIVSIGVAWLVFEC